MCVESMMPHILDSNQFSKQYKVKLLSPCTMCLLPNVLTIVQYSIHTINLHISRKQHKSWLFSLMQQHLLRGPLIKWEKNSLIQYNISVLMLLVLLLRHPFVNWCVRPFQFLHTNHPRIVFKLLRINNYTTSTNII